MERRPERPESGSGSADLVVLPEMFVSGYPPEDLVLKPAFLRAVEDSVAKFAKEIEGGPAVLLGAPWRADGKLYNAALLLENGKIAAIRFKHDLPNYGVFDEKRVFATGPLPAPVPFRGVQLGVMVCEDMWFPAVAETLQKSGAEILISLNASPYERDKLDQRIEIAAARAAESRLPIVYVNQMGGQDELVFDGASFVLGADGSIGALLPAFLEKLSVTRWRRGNEGWFCEVGERVAPPRGVQSVYQALSRGLRDYVNKNYFPGVLIGLSGGIDSALTAAIAVDALGPKRVHCVMMPSPFTSRDSLEDAARCAEALGVTLDIDHDHAGHAGFRRDAAQRLRPAPRRHHRGKYSGAHPRHNAHGLEQQTRLHGAFDRQQIGNVGRLCHPLRRHVRRFLGVEGRLQDGGLSNSPAGATNTASIGRWDRRAG